MEGQWKETRSLPQQRLPGLRLFIRTISYNAEVTISKPYICIWNIKHLNAKISYLRSTSSLSLVWKHSPFVSRIYGKSLAKHASIALIGGSAVTWSPHPRPHPALRKLHSLAVLAYGPYPPPARRDGTVQKKRKYIYYVYVMRHVWGKSHAKICVTLIKRRSHCTRKSHERGWGEARLLTSFFPLSPL